MRRVDALIRPTQKAIPFTDESRGATRRWPAKIAGFSQSLRVAASTRRRLGIRRFMPVGSCVHRRSPASHGTHLFDLTATTLAIKMGGELSILPVLATWWLAAGVAQWWQTDLADHVQCPSDRSWAAVHLGGR